MTPTRNALTTGLDMRMKEGTKTRRERRGQGGVNSGRGPFLSAVVLPVAAIPESMSGRLTPRPLSPALQAPAPALHTRVAPQRPQDALQKEDPQKQRGRRRQAHARSLARPVRQIRDRLRSREAPRIQTESPAASMRPSWQANAGSYSNHQ